MEIHIKNRISNILINGLFELNLTTQCNFVCMKQYIYKVFFTKLGILNIFPLNTQALLSLIISLFGLILKANCYIYTCLIWYCWKSLLAFIIRVIKISHFNYLFHYFHIHFELFFIYNFFLLFWVLVKIKYILFEILF